MAWTTKPFVVVLPTIGSRRETVSTVTEQEKLSAPAGTGVVSAWMDLGRVRRAEDQVSIVSILKKNE